MMTYNKSPNSIFLLGIGVRTLVATMILLSSELALNRTYATLYEIEVLDQLSGRGTSLALDSQDRPHISYSSFSDDLRYAFWDGSAWQKEVIRRLKELAHIAEQEGVILGHENCEGWGAQSPKHLKALIMEVDSPAFKMIFDPGNPLSHDGTTEDVWEFYRTAGPWICHFQYLLGHLLQDVQ